MASVEELARTSLELFNRGDFDGMRDLMAPGFIYEETGTGRRLPVDEAIAAFRQWRTGLPDVHGTVERILADGDTVAMEVLWRSTHTGTLSTPNGDLPPTGRSTQAWATLWLEWKDGKLTAERHHLDLLSLLSQLGAIPVPA